MERTWLWALELSQFSQLLVIPLGLSFSICNLGIMPDLQCGCEAQWDNAHENIYPNPWPKTY